jgi:stearoyl-CoA desaturase (delta-9 desaturase)
LQFTQLPADRPWARAWWRASEGNGAVFFYLVVIHLLAVTGLILFPLPSFRVFAIALAVCFLGGIGTSVCYHRSLSHRSVKLHPVVEQLLIFLTMFNGSGSPLSWTANHRHHHSKADTEDDVSSPRHGGFWWSHIRWIYQWSGSSVQRWCPDLDKPRYRFWERMQIPVLVLSLFSGFALGWEGFFWIGAIRLVYALHLQMTVNSVLHMTPGLPAGVDSSLNLWWLGPLQLGAWGENWHRNHHGDQNAAKFGRAWWQFDFGWVVIRGLEAVGLASQIKPQQAQLKNRLKTVQRAA